MLLSTLAIGFELGLNCGRGDRESCILSSHRYGFLHHSRDSDVGNTSSRDRDVRNTGSSNSSRSN